MYCESPFRKGCYGFENLDSLSLVTEGTRICSFQLLLRKVFKEALDKKQALLCQMSKAHATSKAHMSSAKALVSYDYAFAECIDGPVFCTLCRFCSTWILQHAAIQASGRAQSAVRACSRLRVFLHTETNMNKDRHTMSALPLFNLLVICPVVTHQTPFQPSSELNMTP